MNKFFMIAPVAAFALGACSVDQTEEAELPDVDVTAEEGNMPEFDVDTADVEVGTEEKTIEVPTVDVDMPEDQDKAPE